MCVGDSIFEKKNKSVLSRINLLLARGERRRVFVFERGEEKGGGHVIDCTKYTDRPDPSERSTQLTGNKSPVSFVPQCSIGATAECRCRIR